MWGAFCQPAVHLWHGGKLQGATRVTRDRCAAWRYVRVAAAAEPRARAALVLVVIPRTVARARGFIQ